MSVTPNFSQDEFRCKHCGKLVLDPRLPVLCQQIRTFASKEKGFEIPLIVSSGYRCPEHNARVGGVPDSQHVHGKAADLIPRGITARELHRLIMKAYYEHRLSCLGGLGLYRTFVHVDTFMTGKLRRWHG